MESIQIIDLVTASFKFEIIDVRSPGEFKKGHIPGASNIPLFEDDERAEIGTFYKQVSREAAIDRGLEIVGPKMAGFVKEVRKRVSDSRIIIYCWRGGMRSASFAWLLNTAGIEVAVLTGGYKAFRSYMHEFWEQPVQLKVITGCTGSGKTDLLHYFDSQSEQTVDLEGLARHKGSAFGGIGQEEQPTSEQFQNNLFWKMKALDLSKPIWIEDESINIGQVCIPDKFWFQILGSPVYVLHLNRTERIRRLVKEYGSYSRDKLQSAIKKISKKLGGLRTQKALEHLDSNNLRAVVEDVLAYYDGAYLRSIEKRRRQIVWENTYNVLDLPTVYKDIIS